MLDFFLSSGFGYGGNRFGTPSQYLQSTLDKEFNSPLVIYPNLFCSDIINDIGLAVNEDKGFQLGDVYKLRPIGIHYGRQPKHFPYE